MASARSRMGASAFLSAASECLQLPSNLCRGRRGMHLYAWSQPSQTCSITHALPPAALCSPPTHGSPSGFYLLSGLSSPDFPEGSGWQLQRMSPSFLVRRVHQWVGAPPVVSDTSRGWPPDTPGVPSFSALHHQILIWGRDSSTTSKNICWYSMASATGWDQIQVKVFQIIGYRGKINMISRN